MSLSLKGEALAEFLGETEEMLDRISLNLGKIEDGDDSDEVINELYRDMHSIKGSAYLFGCNQMGQVAHSIESSLDPVRNKKFKITSRMVDVVCEGLDLLKEILDSVSSDQHDIDFEPKLSVYIPKIGAVTLEAFGADFFPARDDVLIGDHFEAEKTYASSGTDSSQKVPVIASVSEVAPVKSQSNLPQKAAAPEPLKKTQKETLASAMPEEKPPQSRQTINQVPAERKEPQKLSQPENKRMSTEKTTNPKPNNSSKSQPPQESKQPETLRVQVNILDKLMNLVGELVLIRNQHLQNNNSSEDSELGALNQRLNIVTGELQEEIMKTRMQPIGTILSKFNRVVRDLSKELGKQVKLVMEGVDTELDKALLEAVKDPLMHIMRNSVDHGIEGPEERTESGKSEQGTVKITSYHEGGQVIVEIEDDGKGLSRERIGQKCLEKGLLTAERLEKLSDRDVYMFIFAPGFSTAEKISNVSGRGVGMDVVRTNIERIGGMVDISSVEGQGTVVRLKIPLTLAIIPALIVKSGGDRFAIPQVKLVELVRLEKNERNETPNIEMLQGQPFYRLRGQLLPLVSLNRTLGISTPKGTDKNSENIVVLSSGADIFGLIVDEIEDSTDIVVKPLMHFLKDLSVYSGATVLGDGSIALAIDVVGLASHVGIFEQLEQEEKKAAAEEIEDKVQQERDDYLLVNVGAPGRYAVPLCVVNRLEEFSMDQIEVSGEQRVVRYRDTLLPLISVPEFLNLPFQADVVREKLPEDKSAIVVVKKANKFFGLEVNEIIDVVNAVTNINQDLKDRDGILGNLILDEEVIVLVDVYKIIESVLPPSAEEIAKRERLEHTPAGRGRFRVLVVDDNAFFRKHVATELEAAGFNVITAVNGEDAYRVALLEAKNLDMIVSDIEMPKMNGFQLCEKVREDQRISKLPLVALTTRFRKADIEMGQRVGFTHYLEKLNPEVLIATMDEVLSAA